MDPSIRDLKKTTFHGRRLTRREIAGIQKTVGMFPALSRRELALTVCEHLNWRTPSGGDRLAACLRTLEHLELEGVLTLPSKRDTASGPPRPIRHTAASDPQPEIACRLSDLEPLSLAAADGRAERSEWNELVDRHHPLGCPRPFGPSLRWFILDRDGRRLGCLLFEAAARELPARDEWIGWDARQRERWLHLALGNSRFLILPWVRVANLASRALGMAVERLPGEWRERHGYRPVLVETFVDPTRHDGACYRAANWTRVGETAGRKSGKRRKPAKEIYAKPLDEGFRDALRGRPRAPPTPEAPEAAADGAAPPDRDDPLVGAWLRIIDAATALADAHDGLWRRRRRVLGTLLVMLFVFRLVLSRGQKGYATVLAELWEQCRRRGVALPQARPVAASSICKARARVDEGLFLDLHREILRHAGDGARWHGHRLLAVDGSKMLLPRPLADAGFKPLGNGHYPQGLVSCLYRLDSKVPVDFSLSAHACERTAAMRHLQHLSEGDIVVFDRGYFSYEMLYAVLDTGAHPVFRLQRGNAGPFKAFMDGDARETRLTVSAGADARRKLAARWPDRRFEPVPLRLVRQRAEQDDEWILATTLTDPGHVSADDLAELYHGRWSIEELYKVSKKVIAVDEFHAQTGRGVRQELYAHFNLVAMTRILSGPGDELLADMRGEDSEPQVANFKNAVAMVAMGIEELFLAQASAIAEAVKRLADGILRVRARLRPGRSYPRKSMRPADKWSKRSNSKSKTKTKPA